MRRTASSHHCALVVAHRAALAGLQRQVRLGTVEHMETGSSRHRRRRHRISRWFNIQASDVFCFRGEAGSAGPLEGADAAAAGVAPRAVPSDARCRSSARRHGQSSASRPRCLCAHQFQHTCYGLGQQRLQRSCGDGGSLTAQDEWLVALTQPDESQAASMCEFVCRAQT